jgi:hypothetical protein
MGNIDIARETYHQPATRHRREHPVARALGLGLAGVFAIYLLGRGVAEFFVIHYSDPASYRNDWGGPSLAGVFAVHSGPAVLIVAGAGVYASRVLRRHRQISGRSA